MYVNYVSDSQLSTIMIFSESLPVIFSAMVLHSLRLWDATLSIVYPCTRRTHLTYPHRNEMAMSWSDTSDIYPLSVKNQPRI